MARAGVPRPFIGARPPLLDRLIDLDPTSPADTPGTRRLDIPDLVVSVRRSLANLLECRRPRPLTEHAARPLTVTEFGVPDFGSRSPTDPSARALYGEAIRQAVLAFEPRLQNPAIDVMMKAASRGALEVRITGVLRTATEVEQAAFVFALDESESSESADAAGD